MHDPLKPRERHDTSCALCDNGAGKGHVLCKACREKHSPASAFKGYLKNEVVYYGCVGSGWEELMAIVHCSDDFYDDHGISETHAGRSKRK